MPRNSKNQLKAVTAPVVTSIEAVEIVVVGTPVSDLMVWDVLPELGELCIYPQPVDATLQSELAEGTFYVRKPTRSQVRHDGNDLGRAVTLILQLLPLTDHPSMLQSEIVEVQQLLLKAAYMLETADVTPADKAKINVVA